MSAIDSPWIEVCPIDSIPLRGCRVVRTRHMQIASAPFRREPTTGELDDRHILKLVERLGYTGYIGCEYHPERSTVEGLAWMYKLIDRPPSR